MGFSPEPDPEAPPYADKSWITCSRTRAEVSAELDEDLSGDALALADQPEQDVLRAYVVVAELQRLAQAQLQDLLGSGRERDMAARRVAALADQVLHLASHRLQADAHRLEGLRGYALALMDQPEQDVLRADVVVAEEASLFLRQNHDSTSPVGEPLEHRSRLQDAGMPHVP